MDIVAITRSLDADAVLRKYAEGVFPMGYPGRKEITWRRPPRRGILPLESFHASRSLERTLRQGRFSVTFNTAFQDVMRGCARPDGTWITETFHRVYGELHRRGRAHSVEVWVEGALAGGVYGVHLGAAFFAESKFHRVRDMSKVALAHLVMRLRERGFLLLDVQYWSERLAQFGVVETPRQEYEARLEEALRVDCAFP
jgi:leucyl/phenylalanyl-tRNA--protein transferase